MFARTSPGILEIARGVHWLPTRGANVYFVRSGGSWVLIDAGFLGSGRVIAAAARRLCGAAGRPEAILITHGHPDHVGSAVGLAAAWNVPIMAPAGEMPFIDGTALYPEPLVAWLARVLPQRTMEALVRGSDLGDAVQPFDPQGGVPGLPEWTCVPTPGHTPGHVAFFRPGDRTLIAGDAVLTMAWSSRLAGGGAGAGSGTWCVAGRGSPVRRPSSPVIGEPRPRPSRSSPTSTRGSWRPATARHSWVGTRLRCCAPSRPAATEPTEAEPPLLSREIAACNPICTPHGLMAGSRASLASVSPSPGASGPAAIDWRLWLVRNGVR